MSDTDKIRFFYLSVAIFAALFFIFQYAYAQYDIVDNLVNQTSEGIKSTIDSIQISGKNPIDTNQQEINNLANSASEWVRSLFDFGKKSHEVTVDTMTVLAPSWIAPIIIIVIAAGIVVFIVIKGIKKVGLHLFIALAILAAVIVFLMLLDLLS